MSVRDSPLIPMTKSGHCSYGPDHTKCKRQDCTCDCHKPKQEEAPHRRTRKKLI